MTERGGGALDERVEELYAKATRGPWRSNASGKDPAIRASGPCGTPSHDGCVVVVSVDHHEPGRAQADIDLIAALYELVPQLSAQLAAAEEAAHSALDLLEKERAQGQTLREERDAWQEIAAQESRNRDYYRELVTEIGDLFGIEARTADDGGIAEGVLAAKVPDLVRALREQQAATSQDLLRLQGEGLALREALHNTATRIDGDGQPCWCSVNLSSGLHAASHAPYCINARVALAPRPR